MTQTEYKATFLPRRNYCDVDTCQEISSCRACNSADLYSLFELGNVPLANGLLLAENHREDELKFPLTLMFCQNCTLVQLKETVSPQVLFREYPYFSSFSDTVLASAREAVDKICARKALTSDSLVIEIGSNDGYLLKNYVERSIPVLGIEPAANIAKNANKSGINTISEFFGLKLAEKLVSEDVRADVVHANNVVAHIPDVVETFQAIACILKEKGIAVIEVPYVKQLIDNNEFDTIYHEHIFYFSLTAIDFLAKSAGLIIGDVEELEIHGGSVRVTLAKTGEPSEAVLTLLAKEERWGVRSETAYLQLSEQVRLLRLKLQTLLEDLKTGGASIAAYGASAKGTTLLSFFQIGQYLDFVVDRSTAKQECLTPGTYLMIYAPLELAKRKIDYTLLLVWNFAEEIFSQQREYLKSGGAFIIPLPDIRIVRWNHETDSLQITAR